MSFAARAWLGAPGGVLALTGATIEDIATSPPAEAYLILRSDGTVDKVEGGTVTQLNASTDWITPNTESGAPDFEAKWDRVSGISPTQLTPGWTEGVYADLTSDLQLGYSPPDPESGAESGTVTVTIRRKSNPADLVSANFELTAVELP